VCVENSFACMVQHFALQALDSSPSPPSSSCCPFPVHRCDAAADSLPPSARVHSLPRITPSPSHPFILSVVRLHYLVAGAKIIVIAPRTYPTSFNIENLAIERKLIFIACKCRDCPESAIKLSQTRSLLPHERCPHGCP